MSAGFPGLLPHWRAVIEAVGRSEWHLVVVEVFETVFAGMPLGDGLAPVGAIVIVDQAGAVSVRYGVGELAEAVAQLRDGSDGEVVRRRQGIVVGNVHGDGGL